MLRYTLTAALPLLFAASAITLSRGAAAAAADDMAR